MPAIVHIASKLKPLLLLLSSDQPGEVAAAAAAIKRTLKGAGLDFHDLVAELTATSAKPKFQEEPEEHDAGDWRALRDYCLKHSTRMRDPEREFVESLRKWRGHLTTKQRDWLEAIHTRLQRMAA